MLFLDLTDGTKSIFPRLLDEGGRGSPKGKGTEMHGIFYIIGVVVVVLAIINFIG